MSNKRLSINEKLEKYKVLINGQKIIPTPEKIEAISNNQQINSILLSPYNDNGYSPLEITKPFPIQMQKLSYQAKNSDSSSLKFPITLDNTNLIKRQGQEINQNLSNINPQSNLILKVEENNSSLENSIFTKSEIVESLDYNVGEVEESQKTVISKIRPLDNQMLNKPNNQKLENKLPLKTLLYKDLDNLSKTMIEFYEIKELKDGKLTKEFETLNPKIKEEFENMNFEYYLKIPLFGSTTHNNPQNKKFNNQIFSEEKELILIESFYLIILYNIALSLPISNQLKSELEEELKNISINNFSKQKEEPKKLILFLISKPNNSQWLFELSQKNSLVLSFLKKSQFVRNRFNNKHSTLAIISDYLTNFSQLYHVNISASVNDEKRFLGKIIRESLHINDQVYLDNLPIPLLFYNDNLYYFYFSNGPYVKQNKIPSIIDPLHILFNNLSNIISDNNRSGNINPENLKASIQKIVIEGFEEVKKQKPEISLLEDPLKSLFASLDKLNLPPRDYLKKLSVESSNNNSKEKHENISEVQMIGKKCILCHPGNSQETIEYLKDKPDQLVHLKCSHEFYKGKEILNKLIINNCPNCDQPLLPQEEIVKEVKLNEENIGKSDEKIPSQNPLNNNSNQEIRDKKIFRANTDVDPEKNKDKTEISNENNKSIKEIEEEKLQEIEQKRKAAKAQCFETFQINIANNYKEILAPEFNLDCIIKSNQYLEDFFNKMPIYKELFIQMINDFIQQNSKKVIKDQINAIPKEQEVIVEKNDVVLKEEKKEEANEQKKEQKEQEIKEQKEEVGKEQKEQVIIEQKEEVVKEQKEQVIKEQKEEAVKDQKEQVIKEQKEEVVKEQLGNEVKEQKD